MVKLFYAPGACSLAVHVVLEWIGAPYEAVRVDQHAPSFRAINPAGAVPALEIAGGTVLTQADAILHYLGRTHPRADLLDERTPETAAEIDRWGSFLTGDLHPAFFPVFTPKRSTTATGPEALAGVVDAGLKRVATNVAVLDAHLRGRDWMAANKRTILDAYALPMLNWASAKLPDGLAPFPGAGALHRRLLADEAVRRVMRVEGLIHDADTAEQAR